MKQHARPGSALLAVLVFMLAFLFLAAHIANDTRFLYNVALERGRYEQHYRALEALLLYGIALYDAERTQRGKLWVNSPWPVGGNKAGTGSLYVEEAGTLIRIEAMVQIGDCIRRLACAVHEPEKESPVRIVEWHELAGAG